MASTTTDPDKATEEMMDTVRPPVPVREQFIKGLSGTPLEAFERTYEQRRMSFFQKLEFGRMVKRLGDGEDGETQIAELIGRLRTSDEAERIQVIMTLVFQLMEHGPDAAKDVLMLALNVPTDERDFVSAIIDQPVGDDGTGGLDDDDAVEIIETFVDQNAKAMRDLFFEKFGRIREKVEKAFFPTQESSKSSKRTRRNTPRR